MDVYVARQPIFDSKKRVFGYELLFRDGFKNVFPDIDGNVATANVLSSTFFSFELREILREKPGFINFTEEMILKETALIFPKEHMIIEVLENVRASRKIIENLSSLKKSGYQIALDDFCLQNNQQALIDLSDIIKLDFRANTREEIFNAILLSKEKIGLTLLAEKIETYREFESARKMGFKLFQGYFFSRPSILSTKSISPNKITKIKLIEEIRQIDIDTERIESLIRNDVSISFKLLKFLNSSYFNRLNPINTIKEAISYLGIDELRKFISIIAISDLNQDKPNELVRRSVIRAVMCEKLGGVLATNYKSDELFTMGLFSLMDALLDHDMKDILQIVGFSDAMKDALLGKVENFNMLMELINGFEKGNWEDKSFKLLTGKVDASKLPEIYFESIKIANHLFE